MASAGEKALHAAVKNRVFDPVYYLFGDDDFLKDGRSRDLIGAAVDPSTRDFNLEVRRASELDPEGLDALLGTPPMMILPLARGPDPIVAEPLATTVGIGVGTVAGVD